MSFKSLIDFSSAPETSLVLRYLNVFKSNLDAVEHTQYQAWIQKTSLCEGAKIFHLLTWRGVQIFVLDETSLMHTKTLKSIDGCLAIAKCKLRGIERLVTESGGNTGTALTVYGRHAGLETFFFIPEANLSFLDSKIFGHEKACLIAVQDPAMVKRAAHAFEQSLGLERVLPTELRYEASQFRGFFILEFMLEHGAFDWIAQTISAAFGPIGIYRVFKQYRKNSEGLPRFLGIQQEANCSMFRAWKERGKTVPAAEPPQQLQTLLTPVMYDGRPQTYGTRADLMNLLEETLGGMTTINHAEFDRFLNFSFDGKTILELLKDHGVNVTVHGGNVVEKTGLIAFAGTFKQIEAGQIPPGNRVLCCLTSGVSEADGKARPDDRIRSLDDIENLARRYGRQVLVSEP